MEKTTTRAATSNIAPFGLRLQPELKSRLEQAATANGRSLNAEIVARLQGSFDLDDQLTLAPGARPAEVLITAMSNMTRMIEQIQKHLPEGNPKK